ncbi:hypothetical protein TNCV_2556431 [Trichonephila clavipes]|nr:hypothetical protein TNCV_2556431 [Trichonephila clavipes]
MRSVINNPRVALSRIHTKAFSVERIANQRLHLAGDETYDWLDQEWRTSGTRAINSTRQNILCTPAIKMVCILFQNLKVHHEVLRTKMWTGAHSFVIVLP